MIRVKAAGKGWNAESVTSMTEAEFIKDTAHAIAGLSEKDNEKTLKGVYKECVKAVGNSETEAK